MFSGLLNLPWWGDVLAGLVLVQITIAGVTIYLHRCQAHSALDLHPAVSHFFRFWLWLTTGMITKEWAAIHRKHHAKCETEDDPHSPRIYGINRVLFGGVFLYVKESHKPETLSRYGNGTPDDWLERNLYTPLHKYGILLLAATDVALFGVVPGAIIYGVQMAWIPFWAAGVINGLGHYFGYRNFQTDDDSTNIAPWAVWIGGEELHNNHHAYPTSAKFSLRWYEVDLGWGYVRLLEALGLATVRRRAPKVRLDPSKFEVDAQTLQAVIMHRYDVMMNYAKSVKRAAELEIAALRERGGDCAPLVGIRKWLHRDAAVVPAKHRAAINLVVESSPALKTTLGMRQELVRLWERSTLTTEQLVHQLKDWCERAEKTGIEPLVAFSHRLRRYA
ncbi:MAG TPA: fatty acid desaturase [Usitatibacter sp.]|nr:fatty acid desaturase [Usitatibacter sp.]